MVGVSRHVESLIGQLQRLRRLLGEKGLADARRADKGEDRARALPLRIARGKHLGGKHALGKRMDDVILPLHRV